MHTCIYNVYTHAYITCTHIYAYKGLQGAQFLGGAQGPLSQHSVREHTDMDA